MRLRQGTGDGDRGQEMETGKQRTEETGDRRGDKGKWETVGKRERGQGKLGAGG